MLRNEVVDEIELEPIETNDGIEGDHIGEGYDEMIYRQDLEYPRGSGKYLKGDYYRRNQILSEIGEIPEEESSMDDVVNKAISSLHSINHDQLINNQNQTTEIKDGSQISSNDQLEVSLNQPMSRR